MSESEGREIEVARVGWAGQLSSIRRDMMNVRIAFVEPQLTIHGRLVVILLLSVPSSIQLIRCRSSFVVRRLPLLILAQLHTHAHTLHSRIFPSLASLAAHVRRTAPYSTPHIRPPAPSVPVCTYVKEEMRAE